MKLLSIFVLLFSLSACASKVIVKKDSCKDIFDGTLMECEQVEKY